MILYNVSIIVEENNHLSVLEWLKSHLRASSHETVLLKMLDSPHEGHTYCVQYQAADRDLITKFQEEVVTELQHYLTNNHAEKAFIFESQMQHLSLT